MSAAMRIGSRVVLLAVAVSGCAEELFVASETRELTPAGPVAFEQICTPAPGEEAGGGFTGASGSAPVDGFLDDDNLEIVRMIVGEELQIHVINRGVLLRAKGYGRRFLESGKLDRFTVMTFGGRRFEFLVRGGPDCESIQNFVD